MVTKGNNRVIHVGGKLVLLLPCLLLMLVSVGCWSAKEDRARLEEVNAIWTRLPVYPGLQEIASTTQSGFGKVFVSKKFRSNASYSDVKSFYVERLRQDGWEVISDRPLKDWAGGGPERHYIEFHRGDVFLSIEHAGQEAGYDWQYAIAVNWSRWNRKK